MDEWEGAVLGKFRSVRAEKGRAVWEWRYMCADRHCQGRRSASWLQEAHELLPLWSSSGSTVGAASAMAGSGLDEVFLSKRGYSTGVWVMAESDD